MKSYIKSIRKIDYLWSYLKGIIPFCSQKSMISLSQNIRRSHSLSLATVSLDIRHDPGLSSPRCRMQDGLSGIVSGLCGFQPFYQHLYRVSFMLRLGKPFPHGDAVDNTLFPAPGIKGLVKAVNNPSVSHMHFRIFDIQPQPDRLIKLGLCFQHYLIQIRIVLLELPCRLEEETSPAVDDTGHLYGDRLPAPI